MFRDLSWGSVSSCDGRRGRRSTLKAWLVYGLIAPTLSAHFLGTEFPGGLVDLTIMIWCVFAVPMGVGAQRLHDLGRSGHWIWLVFLAPISTLWVLPPSFSPLLATELPPLLNFWPDAGIPALVLFMIWTLLALPLLVLPGQPGANRYGPPVSPREPAHGAASDRAGPHPHAVPD